MQSPELPAVRGEPVPRRFHAWRWISLTLCVAACAALNVYRIAFWKTQGVHVLRDFQPIAAADGGTPTHWVRSYGRIEVLNQHWRPVRITLDLRAADGTPPDGVTVDVSADDGAVGAVRVGSRWSRHSFIVTSPPARDGTLSLQLETRALPPQGQYGFGVRALASEPVMAARPIVTTALGGAAAGVFVWLVMAPRRWYRLAVLEPPPAPRVSRATAALVAGGLFLYYAGWSLVRPPLQTGDEPQHMLRAASVRLRLWVNDPGRFEIDRRHANPLVVWEPAATAKLPFHTTQRVTTEELRQIKQVSWPVPERIPPLPPLEKAISSYSTLFYAAVFSIAEPLTSLLGLTPYESTYAYRMVTSGYAALLWALVFVALQRTAATAGLAWPVLLVLAANPMLTYLSSGVTPDAVSNPLSALAILAFWRTLTQGTHRAATFGWLVAGALVKPAGLQLMAALAVGGAGLWLVDRQTGAHVKQALLALAQAAVVVLGGFYVWSPPRFLGEGPSYDGVFDFLARRFHRAGDTWIEYWGRLGWLDYQLDPRWYFLPLALVLVNVVCVWWKPRRPAAFAWFCLLTVFAFLANTLIGEFLYLPQAGYTLVGRYFLPVGLALTTLWLWHQVRAARAGLVIGTFVLSALLAQRTVERYYEDGWLGVREGLPFASARVQAARTEP